ncbi:hypothetical protein Tco_0948842, partial [Tanacetum coccineum]
MVSVLSHLSKVYENVVKMSSSVWNCSFTFVHRFRDDMRTPCLIEYQGICVIAELESEMTVTIEMMDIGHHDERLFFDVQPGKGFILSVLLRRLSALDVFFLIAYGLELQGFGVGNISVIGHLFNDLIRSGLIRSFWLKGFLLYDICLYSGPRWMITVKQQNLHFLLVMLRLELHIASVLAVGRLTLVPAFLKELIYKVLRLQVSLMKLDRFRILLGEREEGQ